MCAMRTLRFFEMKFSNKWLKSYRFLACTLITLLFMAHTAHWLHIPTLQRMENILYDLRLRTTVVNTLDPRIVIIDIDEESLAKEGRWPWRRDKLAIWWICCSITTLLSYSVST